MGKYQQYIERAQNPQRNDKEAQREVGYAYLTGDGVEKDLNEAAIWFKKAAEQNCVISQCELGNLCRDSIYQDNADVWYKKAAEFGHPLATLFIKWSYRHDRNEWQRFEKNCKKSRLLPIPSLEEDNSFINQVLPKLEYQRLDKSNNNIFVAISRYLKEDEHLFSFKIKNHIITNSDKYKTYANPNENYEQFIDNLNSDGIHYEIRDEYEQNNVNENFRSDIHWLEHPIVTDKLICEAVQDYTKSQIVIISAADLSLISIDNKFAKAPIFLYKNYNNQYDIFSLKTIYTQQDIQNCYNQSKTQFKATFQNPEDVSLFTTIKRKEKDHEKLYKKIEACGKKVFLSSSLHDKMNYIRIKHELALLYICAAELSKKNNCMISYGKYLFKSFALNPYLNKRFMRDNHIPILPSITNNRGLKVAAINTLITPPAAIAFTYGMIAVPFIASFLTATALVNNIVERPINAMYRYAKGMHTIPNFYTSEDCLYQAIAHLNDGDVFLSIHYLLCANNRSDESIPEIQYFLDLAKQSFFHLSCNIMNPESMYNDNINIIKNIVNENNHFSDKMYRLNLDCNNPLRSIESTSTFEMIFGSCNFLTIGNVVRSFRAKFYDKYACYKSIKFSDIVVFSELRADFISNETNILNFDHNTYTKEIGMAELLAYLSQIIPDIEFYIQLSISNDQVQYNSDAENYLYDKLTLKDDIALGSLDVSRQLTKIDVKENLDILLILLENEHYIDCESLQKNNAAKYWSSLHMDAQAYIDMATVQKIPLHIRNPIVHMKKFLVECEFNTSRRDVFFNELVAQGCDVNNKLRQTASFAPTLGYLATDNRKVFYTMLVVLEKIASQNLDLFKSFISEYQMHIAKSPDNDIQQKLHT